MTALTLLRARAISSSEGGVSSTLNSTFSISFSSFFGLVLGDPEMRMNWPSTSPLLVKAALKKALLLS